MVPRRARRDDKDGPLRPVARHDGDSLHALTKSHLVRDERAAVPVGAELHPLPLERGEGPSEGRRDAEGHDGGDGKACYAAAPALDVVRAVELRER